LINFSNKTLKTHTNKNVISGFVIIEDTDKSTVDSMKFYGQLNRPSYHDN